MKGVQRTKRLATVGVRAISIAVFLIGVGLALYAGLQWMETARWQPLTVERALARSPATRDWVVRPRSWLGLHSLVVRVLRVPVFLIVTAIGALLLIASTPGDGQLRAKRDFW